MKNTIALLILFLNVVLSQQALVYSNSLKKVVGAECKVPIKCTSNTTFSFCFMVNGEEIANEESYECPTGFVCTSDILEPCVEPENPDIRDLDDITTSAKKEITSTAIVSTTTEEPILQECSSEITGNHRAEKCNEFYVCVRVMWWYEKIRLLCLWGQRFDPKISECVTDPTCQD